MLLLLISPQSTQLSFKESLLKRLRGKKERWKERSTKMSSNKFSLSRRSMREKSMMMTRSPRNRMKVKRWAKERETTSMERWRESMEEKEMNLRKQSNNSVFN